MHVPYSDSIKARALASSASLGGGRFSRSTLYFRQPSSSLFLDSREPRTNCRKPWTFPCNLSL